jgi:hypothetical protein
MCCEPKGSWKGAGTSESGCCCCGPVTFFRRFISSQEEAERLEEYREQLKKEISGVEERIEELKRK